MFRPMRSGEGIYPSPESASSVLICASVIRTGPCFSVLRYPCSTDTVLSCYTGDMEKLKQNLTLVVEEDLLLAARKVALDQRTSVNQLVREYLAALVEEPSRRRLARARLRKAFETGLVEVGERNWCREDLYGR